MLVNRVTTLDTMKHSPSPPPPSLSIVPVEIFDIIASLLTRDDIRNLRLVSRKCEEKASRRYFQSVVVPFRPEIYGNLNHDENGILRNSSSDLLSDGMRIFEGFGLQILRFALSLELDEDVLAQPPVKPTQKVVSTFWGIYRWPCDDYQRYQHLEHLELTADETQSMREALGCLKKVRNIGLCCDAGLGFLSGPDTVARETATQQPVFYTERHFRGRSQRNGEIRPIALADIYSTAETQDHAGFQLAMARRREMLERMVIAAGFTGAQVDQAIRTILETEGTTLADITFEDRSSNVTRSGDDDRDSFLRGFPNLGATLNAKFPLIPVYLTRAQKEFIQEMEWVHRALIQSYVLGLADNAAAKCFSNLTTLTIAKIPGSLVHLFCRDDLWQALTTIKSVSICVVADWRQITSQTPGTIVDTAVSPAETVPKVFELLDSFIGQQENIQSLHFEWICGGEFAPGVFQRNLYVLPAPFFHNPERMTSPVALILDESLMLSLPNIKHFSLKNCWVSPHVMLQVVRDLALSSLETLEFESVSLSGPPTAAAQAPLAAAMVHQPGQTIPTIPVSRSRRHVLEQDFALDTDETAPQAGDYVPADYSLEPPDGSSPADILYPDWYTWAGLVEHFSPADKIQPELVRRFGESFVLSMVEAELDKISAFIPNHSDLVLDQGLYNLKRLSFKSCGYVAVNSCFIRSRAVIPDQITGRMNNAMPLRPDIQSFMQRSKDQLLATISPFIKTQEKRQLSSEFAMSFGWQDVYDSSVIDDAHADGVEVPGCARFSGVMEANQNVVSQVPGKINDPK